MTEQIIRDGDIITIKSETTRVIDLAQLKAELLALEAEPEPSDEELLIHAKAGASHPYFDPSRQFRIDNLKAEIARYEAL